MIGLEFYSFLSLLRLLAPGSLIGLLFGHNTFRSARGGTMKTAKDATDAYDVRSLKGN